MKTITVTRPAGEPVGTAACWTSEPSPIAARAARRRSERANRKTHGERRRRFAAATMAAVMAFAGLAGDVSAALQAVGPIDPVTTLPGWYSDPTGLALQPCVDQNGFCVLTPQFDPLITFPPAPITTTGPISDANFPNESFYFLADSLMNVGPTRSARARIRVALEAAFLGGVAPNTGIVFARVNMARIASGLTPNSTYTVTHPYGSFTFTSDASGASVPAGISPTAAFRTEDPLGASPGIYFPPDLAGTTNTHLGPFLQASTGLVTDLATGNKYVGDPRIATTVTGSPNGNNFFRITGPNIGGLGINTIQTPLFTLSGRVFQGTIASPMTLNRATYTRDGVNTTIDIAATALPNAVLTLSGLGLPTTVMSQPVPGSGNFTAHIVVPGSTLPTGVTLSDSLDTPAPVPHPVTLVDSVIISKSYYDPSVSRLNVVADSLDNVAPLPVLTLNGFPAPNTLDATGAISVATPAAPLNVTVNSSNGGSATNPVSIFTPAPAPVAVGDSATTPPGVPVAIPVLANDTIAAPGVINTGTVVITSPPLTGFAVPALDGTVTYIPPAGFTGPTSFAYTVSNTQGTASNAATVNVSVVAPAPAPVAVNDTASTLADTAVSVPVLANDTIAAPGVINPGSVVISSPPLSGTAVASPTGSVTYTPAAGFTGTSSFAYTVKNTQGAVSNAATVAVTVNAAPAPAPAPAPVAVANSATTVAGTPVTINVLANDTIAAPGVINPASVVISSPPLNGTAIPNLNGTITFTPAAGFTGTTSFAYTVSSTAGVASNAATVTVSVTAVAPASVIAIKLAEFVRAGGNLKSEGTISPAGVKTVTLAFANAAGTILGTAGTATSDTGGRWLFNQSGLVLPLGATTLKVTAADGSTRSAPLAIK